MLHLRKQVVSRPITQHQVNRVNRQIQVQTPDGVEAHQTYFLSYPSGDSFSMVFHTGQGDANGLTNEVLLAILIDRLSADNQSEDQTEARHKLQEALMWLCRRKLTQR